MSLIKVIGGWVGTSQESGFCVLEEELGGGMQHHTSEQAAYGEILSTETYLGLSWGRGELFPQILQSRNLAIDVL